MSEYTEPDLDIIASIDDGIAPFNWRNNSSWFVGSMVKPMTDVALAYCVTNGSYFDAPNAYFVEGWEDGDCEDCKVIGIGSVPPLGDLPQSTLTEIWDEMFTNPNVTEAPYKHIETFNESVERKIVGEMAAKSMMAQGENLAGKDTLAKSSVKRCHAPNTDPRLLSSNVMEMLSMSKPCPYCHGRGQRDLVTTAGLYKQTCIACLGTGAADKEQQERIDRGQKLRERRLDANFTLSRMAQSLGMKCVALSDIEAGRTTEGVERYEDELKALERKKQ